MAPNFVALCTCVILLFVLMYFLLAQIPFLFVELTEPTVSWLLRGLFRNCFLLVAGVGGLAAIAFVVTGDLIFAICMVLVAAINIAARRWVLQHFDKWNANAAGDGVARRRLRQLHLGSMGTVLAQIAIVVGSIPFVV